MCVCLCVGGGWGYCYLALVWDPIMDSMPCVSYAWHWHGVGAHVHMNSHFETCRVGCFVVNFPCIY